MIYYISKVLFQGWTILVDRAVQIDSIYYIYNKLFLLLLTNNILYSHILKRQWAGRTIGQTGFCISVSFNVGGKYCELFFLFILTMKTYEQS